MPRASIIISVILLAISVAGFLEARGFPPGYLGMGAGVFPSVIFMTLASLSLVLVFQQARVVIKKKDTPAPKFTFLGTARIVTLVFSVWLYTQVLQPLGFVYATSFLMIATFRILGLKSWIKTILFSIGISVLLYLLFRHVFMVPLPKPGLYLPYPF
jgi:hypothetical protein